jgi:hypothetical protein
MVTTALARISHSQWAISNDGEEKQVAKGRCFRGITALSRRSYLKKTLLASPRKDVQGFRLDVVC